MPKTFKPENIVSQTKTLEQEEKKAIKHALVPIYMPFDFFDKAYESGKISAHEPLRLTGAELRAFAQLYLDHTQQYLSRLSEKNNIPKAPNGFMNKHSEFQETMVSTAFDLSLDLGVLFKHLQARLTDDDFEEILRDPKSLTDLVSMKKLGLDDFINDAGFEDTANRLWEFTVLSGSDYIFTLARIRQSYGFDSPDYQDTLLVMKDFLGHRHKAHQLKSLGDILSNRNVVLEISNERRIDWDHVLDEASILVGQLNSKGVKRLPWLKPD